MQFSAAGLAADQALQKKAETMEVNISRELPQDEAEFYETRSSRNASVLSTAASKEDIEPHSVDTMIFRCLLRLLRSPRPYEFLQPHDLWISSVYTCLCEFDAYKHLAPMTGKRVLQAGGTGVAAVQFMLAGAKEAWLLTPFESEARYAMEVARLAGVDLNCRIGVAEDIPFEPQIFDAVYTAGCLHHFEIPKALSEIGRVLVPGGRFSAVEPWEAPLYRIGIKLFGKMEPVNCQPLTARRLVAPAGLFSAFRVVHHGTLTRYPALALFKLGLTLSLRSSWNMTRIDDFFSNLLMIRKWGSGVAVLAEK